MNNGSKCDNNAKSLQKYFWPNVNFLSSLERQSFTCLFEISPFWFIKVKKT